MTAEKNSLLALLDPSLGEITPTGLVLKEGLAFKKWADIGARLQQAERSVLWWIGDWLNYGERAYGEMYTQALEDTGFSLGTLKNAKFVASKVETSLRSDVVSYKAHQEVASLPPIQQKEILHMARAEDLTVREVRAFVRNIKHGIAPAPPLPQGKYSLIYADPPWRYEHVKTESRAIENHYPTMGLDEICALQVGELSAEDCMLFLWATSPKLAEAVSVIGSWGFVYRTCAVWDKGVIGMGYYFRQQHELLLVATRGEPGVPATGDRESSVITWPRGRHSEKPASAYELIERMYPHAIRIELFSRGSREGWATWGNQGA